MLPCRCAGVQAFGGENSPTTDEHLLTRIMKAKRRGGHEITRRDRIVEARGKHSGSWKTAQQTVHCGLMCAVPTGLDVCALQDPTLKRGLLSFALAVSRNGPIVDCLNHS